MNIRIEYLCQKLTLDDLITLNVHDEALLKYLSTCYQSFIDYREKGVMPYIFSKGLQSINNENIEYIIKQLTNWKQAGIWCTDVVTPILSDTFRIALASANNSYVVSEYISLAHKQFIV